MNLSGKIYTGRKYCKYKDETGKWEQKIGKNVKFSPKINNSSIARIQKLPENRKIDIFELQ